MRMAFLTQFNAARTALTDLKYRIQEPESISVKFIPLEHTEHSTAF